MSSDLRDHFFYNDYECKMSPKVKVCTSGRCKKGTVKVIWIPYDLEVRYPEEYDKEEKPRIDTPPVNRNEVWKFRYWLRCIARWEDFEISENVGVSSESRMTGGIIDYPIGALYNPEEGKVEKIKWNSGKHFDYKLYNPYNNDHFFEMATYFSGYLSSEVDCDSFEEWFLREFKNRAMEVVKRRERRKENTNTDISYAKRGYWLDEKPKDYW